MRCGPKSKNDLRVKSAAKSDAQCRVSRLPDVYVRVHASSSSTRRGATIDSRESSADVDERWKKIEKKREKFHAAVSRDTQGFHRVKVTAHRFGTPSPIRSTPILDSVLKFNQRPPLPRFKVTSHRAAILFRVSKLFTRLHRNSGRFLCNL